MENASKALIMGAGILIAVMILSLAVYLMITFGSFSAEVHKQNQENEIQSFNAQFLAYEGRDNLTIHDIITVTNYAKENNNSYELSSSNAGNQNTLYIQVKVKIGNKDYNFEQQDQDELNKLTQADISKINESTSYSLPTYKCINVGISSITGRVYIIEFK